MSLHKSMNLESQERRVVALLSGVYGLRMLGLFIVLPVLATAAVDLPAATPILIGVALGIHGLTQALFQIPLGVLSDRIGRRPVIVGGLLVFVLGSVIAATAETMYGLIAGRAIQGAGAVAAVIMALAADLVAEQKRSKAMAVMGVSIGGAFILALIIGAPLEAAFGLDGIFGVSAITGLGAAVIAAVAFRKMPTVSSASVAGVKQSMHFVFSNHELMRLNFGVFVLHLAITANFLLLPVWIESVLHLPRSQQWLFYAPILLGGFVLMLPILVMGEKKRFINKVLPLMVLLLGVSQALSGLLPPTAVLVIVATLMFFIAFNYLEANLPALTSRFCDARMRGAALSVFSLCQFLGMFVGGLLGGVLLNTFGHIGVYVLTTIVILIWATLARGMSEPSVRQKVPLMPADESA